MKTFTTIHSMFPWWIFVKISVLLRTIRPCYFSFQTLKLERVPTQQKSHEIILEKQFFEFSRVLSLSWVHLFHAWVTLFLWTISVSYLSLSLCPWLKPMTRHITSMRAIPGLVSINNFPNPVLLHFQLQTFPIIFTSFSKSLTRVVSCNMFYI